MALYRLKFGFQEMVIDSETLEPGELRGLKDLGQCAHFTLEREPEDKLPGMDHDALDDVAKEIVGDRRGGVGMNGDYGGGAIYQQAKDRVVARGL